MNPHELAFAIEDIISRECQCEASWEQHKQDCTRPELLRISVHLDELVGRLLSEAREKIPA